MRKDWKTVVKRPSPLKCSADLMRSCSHTRTAPTKRRLTLRYERGEQGTAWLEQFRKRRQTGGTARRVRGAVSVPWPC